MTRSIARRRVLAGAGGLALVATAGCGWVDRNEKTSVSRSYDADRVDRLAVVTETGDLEVRGNANGRFRVHGAKRAASEDAIDALSVEARRDGGQLRLETDVGNGPWPLGWWRTPKLSLDVDVPRSLQVEHAETVHGDVAVEGVDGPTTARTETGDLYVAGVRGRVEAAAKAGDVIVRNATGPIDARSETGDLTIDGIVAGLTTETGDVSATIRNVAGAPSIETGTGDVEIALARSLDLTVAARSDAGTVTVHGDGFASATTTADGATIRLGEGADELSIATETGDVSITTV